MRWTLTKFTVLAQSCAVYAFRMMANPELRGPKMTLAKMPEFVAGITKGGCLAEAMPERYHSETMDLAVDFYNRNLAAAMIQVFAPTTSGFEMTLEVKPEDLNKRQTLSTLIDMGLSQAGPVRVGIYKVTIARIKKSS